MQWPRTTRKSLLSSQPERETRNVFGRAIRWHRAARNVTCATCSVSRPMSSGCPGVYACENDTGKGLVVGLRRLPPTVFSQLRPGPRHDLNPRGASRPNDLNRTNGLRFPRRHASQPEPAQRSGLAT